MYNKFKNFEKEISPYKIDCNLDIIIKNENDIEIDISNFEKFCSYETKCYINGMLELDNGQIVILMKESIELIKYNNNTKNLELIKSCNYKSSY